jgi:SAM-dependent MidA family methyltransferase
VSWMIEEIDNRGGEVPFDVFMELALYHPEHGYYSHEEPRYGRDGDFLTAPTASEWYTGVLSRLLVAVAATSGPIRFIDVASGDGAVIAGILEPLGGTASDVLSEVISVERSASMLDRQKSILRSTPASIRWCGQVHWIDPSPTPTVVHASELYDALPVARLVGGRGGPEELVVAVSRGELAWKRRPPRDEVADYVTGHEIELEEGQIAEVNLGAESLHAAVLSVVGGCGLSLVLDYGYETRRLYDPRGRRGGSLTTFSRHQLGRDPLASPGEVDLTAHVNWADLRRAADSAGWREVGLWSLAEFLVRAGIAVELEERGLGMEAALDAATVTARQEVKRLLDPEGMGSDLKVLVQAKGEMKEVAQAILELPNAN